MKEEQYEIPAEVGYTKDLTFRIAPVNKAILKADADWLKKDELCLDRETAMILLLPFIEEYLDGSFKKKDQINLLRFGRARKLASDLEITASYLKKDPGNPALAELVGLIRPDMVLPIKTAQKLKHASVEECRQVVIQHIGIVTEFYLLVSEYILDMTEKYEPRGFHHFSITCA